MPCQAAALQSHSVQDGIVKIQFPDEAKLIRATERRGCHGTDGQLWCSPYIMPVFYSTFLDGGGLHPPLPHSLVYMVRRGSGEDASVIYVRWLPVVSVSNFLCI